jgi:hypothetical protein
MPIKFLTKALIMILVLSFFQTHLTAQEYSNKESSIFCFTLGLTSSNLINDSIHYKAGILFNGGCTYSLALNDKLNVEMELLYTGKAFKTESPIIKYRYFFVDIPLFIQVNLSPNIRANIGGQYSIATNGMYSVLDTGGANGVKSYPLSAIKPVDCSFLLGGEFDLNKDLALGVRYTVSGSAFFEKNAINFGVFQISVKYAAIKTYKVFMHKKKSQQ